MERILSIEAGDSARKFPGAAALCVRLRFCSPFSGVYPRLQMITESMKTIRVPPPRSMIFLQRQKASNNLDYSVASTEELVTDGIRQSVQDGIAPY